MFHLCSFPLNIISMLLSKISLNSKLVALQEVLRTFQITWGFFLSFSIYQKKARTSPISVASHLPPDNQHHDDKNQQDQCQEDSNTSTCHHGHLHPISFRCYVLGSWKQSQPTHETTACQLWECSTKQYVLQHAMQRGQQGPCLSKRPPLSVANEARKWLQTKGLFKECSTRQATPNGSRQILTQCWGLRFGVGRGRHLSTITAFIIATHFILHTVWIAHHWVRPSLLSLTPSTVTTSPTHTS